MTNTPMCVGGCGERLDPFDYESWQIRRYWAEPLCSECREWICPECRDCITESKGFPCKGCVEVAEEIRQATMKAIAAEAAEIAAMLPSRRRA